MLSIIGLNACANAHDNKFTDMDVAEFAKFITNDNVQLVDVRTPEEFAEGHIKGAKNINVFNQDFVEEASTELDKSRPVAVYCRSGKRSADAAQKLTEKGFQVTNLEGGILAWEAAEQPIEK